MLGPSGSGKTTCLMMLAGFETATSGEILLAGKAINRIPPERRDIGMVFQNYALFPHMSIRENLEFPLAVRKVPHAERKRKIDAALAMVNMSGLGARMPGQLSGGQQQRIAVARALVFAPRLVLMDEPLGALDKQLREQMQYEIKRIHKESGITFVYVTHDQGEALTMSDRIAVFNQGVIQQLATPKELYERPQNAFVAQFIGENNSLHGRVLTVQGDTCQIRMRSGETVSATSPRGLQVGSETTISLRPERVQIGDASASVNNRFHGIVKNSVYHGDHLRIVVDICGQPNFVIKVPNARISAPPEIGSAISTGWQTEDCLALN
ncbi:ABC transporter ATP-binding protein [Undibacterium arcticum]